MGAGELEVLDANANPALNDYENSGRPLSTTDIEDVLKSGERVLKTGRDLQALGRDAVDLYTSIKSGNWEAAGRASIKTLEDLVKSKELQELGKEVFSRLAKILATRQDQSNSLPPLELVP